MPLNSQLKLLGGQHYTIILSLGLKSGIKRQDRMGLACQLQLATQYIHIFDIM